MPQSKAPQCPGPLSRLAADPPEADVSPPGHSAAACRSLPTREHAHVVLDDQGPSPVSTEPHITPQ